MRPATLVSSAPQDSSSAATPSTPFTPALHRWFLSEIKPHEPAVRSYLAARFPCVPDSDDIIQECFIRLLRMQHTSALRHPKTVFFTIARNLAIQWIRHRNSSKIVDITYDHACDVASDSPDPADTISRRQESALVTEAIAQLPPRALEVIRLKGEANLRSREIAARLGIAISSVDSHMGAATRKCAAYFAARGVHRDHLASV